MDMAVHRCCQLLEFLGPEEKIHTSKLEVLTLSSSETILVFLRLGDRWNPRNSMYGRQLFQAHPFPKDFR